MPYDGVWNNLTQKPLCGFFSPLTNSSKVKAKISKAVQKSRAKCTSQERSYLTLSENKVKGAGIILRRTRTSVFESSFCQYLPTITRLPPTPKLHMIRLIFFPTGQSLRMLRQNNTHLMFISFFKPVYKKTRLEMS